MPLSRWRNVDGPVFTLGDLREATSGYPDNTPVVMAGERLEYWFHVEDVHGEDGAFVLNVGEPWIEEVPRA